MDQLSKTNAPVLENFWMPFTANRQFKATPRLLAAAEGMYYTDIDGNQVLDGTAGLWCCNAGHGRKKIAHAVERQLATLDYAPTFQMGHPIAFDFASKLAANAPGGPQAKLDRIFFTGSGSESVDTALKIAIAYQRAIGQGTRTRIIGREKGYHGVGFGGISVGGLVNNRRVFPQIPADHMRHTLDIGRNAFSKGLPLTAWNWRTISSAWCSCTAPKPSQPSSSSRCRDRQASFCLRRAIWRNCAQPPTSTESC